VSENRDRAALEITTLKNSLFPTKKITQAVINNGIKLLRDSPIDQCGFYFRLDANKNFQLIYQAPQLFQQLQYLLERKKWNPLKYCEFTTFISRHSGQYLQRIKKESCIVIQLVIICIPKKY